MPSLTFRFPFAPALLLSALCLALVASLPTHAAPAKLIEKISAPTAPAATASPAAAQYVSKDEVPAEVLEKEKEIYRAQAAAQAAAPPPPGLRTARPGCAASPPLLLLLPSLLQ